MCNLSHGWCDQFPTSTQYTSWSIFRTFCQKKAKGELCRNQPRHWLMRLVPPSTNVFTGKQGIALQLSFATQTEGGLVCSNRAWLLHPEQGTWVHLNIHLLALKGNFSPDMTKDAWAWQMNFCCCEPNQTRQHTHAVDYSQQAILMLFTLHLHSATTKKTRKTRHAESKLRLISFKGHPCLQNTKRIWQY